MEYVITYDVHDESKREKLETYLKKNLHATRVGASTTWILNLVDNTSAKEVYNDLKKDYKDVDFFVAKTGEYYSNDLKFNAVIDNWFK